MGERGLCQVRGAWTPLGSLQMGYPNVEYPLAASLTAQNQPSSRTFSPRESTMIRLSPCPDKNLAAAEKLALKIAAILEAKRL